MKTHAVLTNALAGLALVLGAEPRANAQVGCVPKAIINGNNISYQICGVPDIDQRRAAGFTPFAVAGLPGDGSMYCAPTAIMNFMAFMASHGRPFLKPGSRDWSPHGLGPDTNYEDMTADLKALGGMMHTDFVMGTYAKGVENGLRCWYSNLDVCTTNPDLTVPTPDLSVINLSADKLYAPTIEVAAEHALSGGLVALAIGRYVAAPNVSGLWRVGGHVVSMVSATIFGGFKAISFADAADDGNMLWQSDFTYGTEVVQDVFSTFDSYPRIQSQLLWYGTNNYLDGLVTMLPAFALTADTSGFVMHKMSLSAPADAPPTEASFPAAGKNITRIVTNSASARYPFLVHGDNNVWQVNALTGEISRFASVPSANDLVFGGRELQLHILGDRLITTLGPAGNVVARATLAQPVDAVAYDTSLDTLVGVSAVRGTLSLFTPSLQLKATVRMPPVYCAGPITAHSGPGKSLWIHCAGQNLLTKLDLTNAGSGVTPHVSQVQLQGAYSPSSFSIGDSGLIFVSDLGVLRVYDQFGHHAPSPFEGQRAGKLVDVGRSFSNFDPETMTGPAYRNVLPDDMRR